VDFDFREEEQAVADLARKILEDQASNERLREVETNDEPWDTTLWQALAAANLLGTAIPEAQGGSELGFLALCALLQEVGRTVAPVPVYPALVLGALPLARFGSEAQRQAWLPEIGRGERIVTAALVELESSDPLAPATRAEQTGDGLRLTGTKSHVPCAEQASHVLVPARQDDGGVGLFYLETGGEGVRLSTQQTSDGRPHALVCIPRHHRDAEGRRQLGLEFDQERTASFAAQSQAISAYCETLQRSYLDQAVA